VTPRRLAFALALLVLAGALGAGGASGSGSARSGSYVGEVSGTSAFVAVVVGRKGGVLAYVCDSKRIAEWFQGKVAKGRASFALSSRAGYRLEVSVAAGRAGGKVVYPGYYAPSYSFSATAARKPAGLYRGEKRASGKRYLGGWIVLSDGRQRGAVKVGSRVAAAPTLGFSDPEQLAVSVPGAGRIAVGVQDPDGL
jgi:hypothetical protein